MSRLFTTREDKALVAEVRAMRNAASRAAFVFAVDFISGSNAECPQWVRVGWKAGTLQDRLSR